MADRFDKFTERARRVLTVAQEEAQRFGHGYIGTEHLLLGLMLQEDGLACRVLVNLGVEPTKLRSAVEFIIRREGRAVLGEIGLTPRSKKVIELAVDEARRMSHHYIGTEHLLLGLVREGEGIAAGVLESLAVNLARARTEVAQVLAELSPEAHAAVENEPGAVRRWSATSEFSAALWDALSGSTRGVLGAAWSSAQLLHHQGVMPQHLLFALLQPGSGLSRSLREHGGDPDALLAAVKRMLGIKEDDEAPGDSRENA